MRYLPFLFLLCSLILLEACQSGIPAGYTQSESGLVYKHHIAGNGEKPTTGCRVYYHVDFRREDSVITSSRSQNTPVELTIPEKTDNNYLREVLVMMAPGDSLTMIRLKDSVRNPLPSEFQSGDIIYIDIVLKHFKSKEEVLKERDKVLAAFTPTPLGTFIKRERETGNPKPTVGNGMLYNVKLKKGNSTVFNTFEKQPSRMQLPENLTTVMATNPIMEALTYMGEGDSLRIAIEYDSVPRLFKPEWGYQNGDIGLFELRVEKILSKEEVEREKAEYEAMRKAKEQEQDINGAPYRARYEEVKKSTAQIVKEYTSGKLKPKKTIKGLKYMIVEEGKGISAGDESKVAVHYSGFLRNGTEFDSSFKIGKPIQFSIGKGHVIEGWDIGLDLLKEGGSAYLFIPPSLAYGELGSPPRIPGNSELIFYVELLKVAP